MRNNLSKKRSGLIEGYPDKTFGPKKNTTRAEAAVIICRFKKY
ncbi:MAG TPA: hypothetical protein DCK87_02980 [Desulfotomaculum sp.]|nr:hypothetical protein [Desulfotomaculum sp.]